MLIAAPVTRATPAGTSTVIHIGRESCIGMTAAVTIPASVANHS